ncbi:hypothetical protein HGA88_02800 [Candidatus Roizmanbacteria bacterium]|nr:hypothetical protein [Candidatus Roizmanbacteria bacterium]
MNKPNVMIVSIPGMIEPKDWKKLEEKANVAYFEKNILTISELLDLIKTAEYLMLNYDVIENLPEEFYKEIKARNYPLKGISTDITGMTWAHPEFAHQYGITLMNTPNYSTVSVAEFAFTSLLLHAKKLNFICNEIRENNELKPLKNDVLFNKTLGIIGLGAIGSRMAELALGFGMNVIGWNRTNKSVQGVEMKSLKDVFTESDYVSLHLKTTPETGNIVNKKMLDLTKKKPIIVNQADGALVNNDDMLDAIQSGKVAGYSTVIKAIKDHALLNNPNVTAFPAQAWFTDHSLDLLKKIWVENIFHAIDGEMQNVI